MATKQHDWTHWLRHKASSDVGMRRGNNQDSFAIQLAANPSQWQQRGHLFLVADGMGAHAAGELASKLAADHVPLIYQKQIEEPPAEGLETALHGANLEIFRRGRENLEFHNMGTTCSALLLLPQGAIVGHVGDSRVYRLRGDNFSQLTFDHSLVWEMQYGSGKMPGDESALLPGIPKNVITRSLGPHPVMKVDMEGPFPIELGDTFLLCSDGLTGPLSDNEIAIVLSALEPDQSADMLIDLANLHGGPDNITVVVCKVIDAALTTKNQNDSPVIVGNQGPDRREVHPTCWVAIGVIALCAGALLTTGHPILAAATMGIAVVAALAAISYRSNIFARPEKTVTQQQQLGKGPYRQTTGFSAEDFCQKLAEKLLAARVTVDSREWQMDWSEFDQHQLAAASLVASGQATQAIGIYAKAVRTLVAQARKKLKASASDTRD